MADSVFMAGRLVLLYLTEPLRLAGSMCLNYEVCDRRWFGFRPAFILTALTLPDPVFETTYVVP